jgi:GNAT superfamily N-acetyltransferase
MNWIKAVHKPTSTIIGVAGWAGPDLPIHNIFRRSATDFYGWREKMSWTDAEIEEMWSHVNDAKWSEQFAKDDGVRRDIVEGKPHWYLAPLLTFPEWQGRGVGKKLLNWAIEQADATDPPTPMYLESRPTARAVYMHVGFVPQGEYNFLRRGPAIVKGLEDDTDVNKDDTGKEKLSVVDVAVVAQEIESDLAS